MDDDAVRTPRRKDREDQQTRRVRRCPSRIAEIRRGLPPGFVMEELNKGSAIRLTGPKDFLLVFYPVSERVQYRNQWRSMRATTIVKLMREIAGG